MYDFLFSLVFFDVLQAIVDVRIVIIYRGVFTSHGRGYSARCTGGDFY